MNGRSSWKLVVCLIALVLVSGLAGGLAGYRYARMEFQRRSDPGHWNETAMRDLERALKPTPEQRQKIQDHLDAAVEELKDVRADTIRRSAEIVLRLVGQVDRELTPEQRVAFERFKPKPGDLSNLDLLNVETRKK
jgi:predicted Holliday junction resolvase-like endonuclease